MDQPQFRYQAKGNQAKGLTYMPVVKSVVVTVTAAGADIAILHVEAGTYVRCFARISDGLSGTTPTVDIGTASTADALIANTAWDEAADNAVAQSTAGIFFATAGNVTMDVGGTGTVEGEVEVFFELYNLTALAAAPDNTVTISA